MLKPILWKDISRGEKGVKAISMLAGILIGLAIAGVAIPITYGVITHSWAQTTTTRTMTGCEDCASHHHGYAARPAEHGIGNCNGNCERERDRDYLKNTTTMAGKIISVDPDNGTLTLDTGDKTIDIVVHGRWSDGVNIIHYSDLLSKLSTGTTANITIITCHDDIHALKIIVDNQEYYMVRGHAHH